MDWGKEYKALPPMLSEEDCKRLKLPYRRTHATETRLLKDVSKIYAPGTLHPETENDTKKALAESAKPYAPTYDERAYERSRMTPTLRQKILERDHFRCVRCGRTPQRDGVRLEVDHIIPISKGGKTVLDNLQTLCFECNRGKGAR